MDFTVVVQDFLLEEVVKEDIFNLERLDRPTTWTVTAKESDFRRCIEQGRACFELGGIYFVSDG